MADATCGCGCNGKPSYGRFLKGHNARLRGHGYYPHGSLKRYKNLGCRCDECRAANRMAKTDQARRRGVLPAAEANARRRKPKPPKPPRLTPAERFARYYEVRPDGCWIWQRALNHGGYGVAWDGTRTLVAHRYAYLLYVGPIPDGLHLDHLCRVRACVNPAHLEPVTQAENNRRAAEANR